MCLAWSVVTHCNDLTPMCLDPLPMKRDGEKSPEETWCCGAVVTFCLAVHAGLKVPLLLSLC